MKQRNQNIYITLRVTHVRYGDESTVVVKPPTGSGLDFSSCDQVKEATMLKTNGILGGLLVLCIIILAGCAGGGSATDTTLPTPTTWAKIFGRSGPDEGVSVQQTSDGGYIVAGSTLAAGTVFYDVYLIKTDSNGNLTWEKTFGASGNEWANSVKKTSDGGYVVVGDTDSFGSPDIYLIKTDSNGSMAWEKTLGVAGIAEHASSIQEATDGGYIIAGFVSGAGYPDVFDVYLIKTDSNGNLVWDKTFGGADWDLSNSVQQTLDGGYIIAGKTSSFGAGHDDVYLIKTDSSGDLVWEKTFGGTGDDYGNSVQQTADGGYVIAGGIYSYGTGRYEVYLIKTDSNGNLVWDKTFGGTDWDYGFSVQQTLDGGYIVAGYYSVNTYNADIYLIKTDSGGNAVWEKTFAGEGWDVGLSAQQTSDAGYIVVGNTQPFGTNVPDIYLIKTDSSGNVQ